MKKIKYMLPLLLSLLLTSCSPDIQQRDWHINTLELADEYFPKYFDAIEHILQKNNVQYEKEYHEQVIGKNKWDKSKYYIAKYIISEMDYFEAKFEFDYWINNGSFFNFKFMKYAMTEEEMLSLPQSYINVMIGVNDFCAYNLLGTGEEFNTYFDEIKEKYLDGETDDSIINYLSIFTGKTLYRDLPPARGINLHFNDEEYKLVFYLKDFLTDINIWDK